ncbi:hypothetical protein FB45DRAFT_760102, partial [Roridomyces roridus]
KIVDGCPVSLIREVLDDGTDILVGHAWELEGSGHWEERSGKADERPRESGFPDHLAPSHHGRGIMTDAVHTMLHKWGIPRMAVRRMVIEVLAGNQGSVRVFEKNGSKFRRNYDDVLNVRGKIWSVHVLDWSLEEEESK